jgi:hypothetical protein
VVMQDLSGTARYRSGHQLDALKLGPVSSGFGRGIKVRLFFVGDVCDPQR